MLKQWFLIFGLSVSFLTAKQLAAETIRIRGGEHDTFTRLVLDLPRPLEWSGENGVREYRVTLFGIKATFDMRDTFSKITTNRVDYVRPSPGASSLVIGLGCDCVVRPVFVGNRMLALDVYPRGMSETSRGLGTNQAREIGRKPAFKLPVVFDRSRKRIQIDPPEQKAILPAPAQIETQPGVNDEGSPAEMLSKQLIKAQRLGLIGDIGSQPGINGARSDVSVDDAESQDSEKQNPARKGKLNMRVSTGADIDRIEENVGEDGDQQGTNCIPSDEVNIAAWGADSSFSKTIGRLRSDLIGEFDRVNEDSVMELARFYIRHGFGVEAVSILNQFHIKDHEYLTSMAEILEFGTPRDSNVFQGMITCENASALWALLSGNEWPVESRPNEDAIFRSMNELPANIRGLLTPLVREKLVSLGMTDAAEEVVRLAFRAGAGDESGVQFADSMNKLNKGDAAEAEEILSIVSETDAIESPLAMLEFIKSKVRSRAPIDFEAAQLVAAMSQEWKNSAHGTDLAFASIYAFALSDAYAQALGRLGEIESVSDSDDTNGEELKEARSFVYSELALHAPASLFLSSTLSLEDDDINDLSEEAATRIAERLAELGFPAQAVDVLDANFMPVEKDDRRVLRARAALELDQPDLAEAELAGVAGAEANFLRARAMEMRGNFQSAYRIYDILGEVEKVEALEFLVKTQANQFVDSGSANLSSENDLSDPALNESQVTVTLEASREELANSEETRNQIEEVLGRYSYE